jgi:hypothetical protein
MIGKNLAYILPFTFYPVILRSCLEVRFSFCRDVDIIVKCKVRYICEGYGKNEKKDGSRSKLGKKGSASCRSHFCR